ncbi:MAG: protein kinase domain-containing protein, partial [Myxococcota bacterium]
MALGTSPANALAAAERIFLGRYVIDAPLPWNGLAFMFRAVEPGRVVAVAALPGDVSEDAQAAKRFRRRAAELAELRHPALLPITEAGVEQGVPYLEMEFADGRPLQDVVDEEGPLGRERAFRIADAVLDLLEVAHDARWLHWDLTPANVLLVPDPAGERVVVLGLGFRALLPGKPRPGGSGPLADRFVAPEVAAGRGDGRSDLYSVGALLYFMVTGARPPRPNGGARRAGWARPVVERALAGRSVDRFADARSMRATLRKAYEGQTVPVPRRRMRSGPLLWVAAGALCLAVGGGSALLWMRLGQNPTSARTHTLASQHPSERSEPGAERSEGPRG